MTVTQPTENRRHFQRIHFESPAVLSQGSVEQTVAVIDLSLNGVLVDDFDASSFDLSQSLILTLCLTENANITMELGCAHRAPATSPNRLKCGFRCRSIDLDSVTHLRRLVELNIGNTAALDRELSELIGDSN